MIKQTQTIIIIILLVGALAFIGFKTGKLPGFEIIDIPSGAQFIKNPSNPTSTYSVIVESSNYPCNSDICIVSGVMTIDKELDEKVIFRTNVQFSNYNEDGKWIAIDVGRGILDSFSFSKKI